MNEVITLPVNYQPAQMERLIQLTLATCASPQTRRMYAVQLRKFIASGHPLTREGVALHVQAERDAGKGSASLGSVVSAIRKLAIEANLRGLLPDGELNAIKAISPGKQYRTRAGLWLTVAEVRKLLALPDRKTYFGCRDACLLAIMAGCGLRREEMSNLRWEAYQPRDGRMCLVDFVGKGRKLRTVPVPNWAQADVDAWKARMFSEQRPVAKGVQTGENSQHTFDPSRIMHGLGADQIHVRIEMYGEALGVKLTPHDLRRTLAKMLRRSGAPLEQIQYTLGHESLLTTQRYLGGELELAPGKASVDKLDLQGVSNG